MIAAAGLFIAYTLACLCLGAMLSRLLGLQGKRERGASAELTTTLLLGQGAMANLWLALALCGWLSPAVIIIFLILSTLAGAAFLRPKVVHLPERMGFLWRALKTEALTWKLLALLTLFVLIVEGAGALMLPPTGDAAAFYMAFPKVIAASHRLKPLPGYEGFTQIGLQGELHYAALISLGSTGAAKLLVWLEALAVAVLLLKIAALLGLRRRGLLIALAVLVSSTAFTILIPDGKVDLFGAALGMAAFYWALQVEGRPAKSVALRLAGLFTGLAVIAKLSYIVPLIAGVVLLVVWRYALSWKERSEDAEGGPRVRWPLILCALLTLALWMIVPAVPHSIKNIVLFREPLAPVINFRTETFIEQLWFSAGVTRRIVLTYPLALVFGEYPMQGGTLSPLLLAFAPFLFILRRARPLLRSPLVWTTIAAALGTILWVIARPSILAPRYILASLLLFIPVVARGAEVFSEREERPRLVSAAMQAAIALSLFMALLAPLSNVRYVPLQAMKYLRGTATNCDLAGAECYSLSSVNEEAKPGERVYLETYFSYWLRPDLLQCMSSLDEKTKLSELQTPAEGWGYLYDEGFRYVVMDEGARARLEPGQAPSWLRLIPLKSVGGVQSIRLESVDTARQPRASCREVNSGNWEVVGRLVR